MSMTPMRHALCARLLIKACGGLEEAATVCRLKKSRLQECCSPESGAFLPIDVIATLEEYCGVPHYSREVADCRPASADGQSLLLEACKTVETTTALMAKISAAQEDHVITPAERQEIERAILAVAGQLQVLSQMNAKAGRPS